MVYRSVWGWFTILVEKFLHRRPDVFRHDRSLNPADDGEIHPDAHLVQHEAYVGDLGGIFGILSSPSTSARKGLSSVATGKIRTETRPPNRNGLTIPRHETTRKRSGCHDGQKLAPTLYVNSKMITPKNAQHTPAAHPLSPPTTFSVCTSLLSAASSP